MLSFSLRGLCKIRVHSVQPSEKFIWEPYFYFDKQDNIKLCRRCMFILIYLPAMSILRASLLVPQCSSALSHLQLLQEFLCLNDYKNIPLILWKFKFFLSILPFTSIMCYLLSLPGSSCCTRCIRSAISWITRWLLTGRADSSIRLIAPVFWG